MEQMTNEQLAGFIQQGDSNELIPILWERVRKLLYMKSEQAYRKYKDKFDQCGIESWDIKQASYEAFLEAVRAYKSDSGLKFTAYLSYPFRNAVNRLTGSRSTRTIHEPLNNSTSLNKPLESSEDDVLTLLDTLYDESSLDFIQHIETASEGETIRAVVDTLAEQHREVIALRFFEGLTLKQSAERLGVSPERVRQREAKALRLLRENVILRKMWNESCSYRRSSRFSFYRSSPEYYSALKHSEHSPQPYGEYKADLLEAQLIWQARNDVID